MLVFLFDFRCMSNQSNKGLQEVKDSNPAAMFTVNEKNELKADFWELLQTAFGSAAADEWTATHRADLLSSAETIQKLIEQA